jgi:MFS family permease
VGSQTATRQPADPSSAPLRLGGVYYGWVLVVMLGITQTITWGIVYYGFTVFLPVLEADRGWTRGQMSGAFSIAMLLSGLGAAPVGQWLDARGPRVLMTAGSVVATLLLLALSRVQTLTEFYVVWALTGIVMSGVLYEPAFAVVTAWFERQRTRAITAVTLMAGFASTIFMPIEAWLIDLQGWRTALVTLAAFLAITTILPHALLLRRRPEDVGQHLDGDPPAPGGTVAVADASGATDPTRAAPPGRASRPPVSVSAAIAEPAFRWLAVAFSLSTVVNIAIGVHLVAYLQDRAFEPGFAATATGLVGAMQVAGRIVLMLLGDRLPLRVVSAAVLAIQPLSILVLLLVPSVAGVFLFIFLFGTMKGALTLIRPSVVVALYGRARYATMAGALAAFVLGATALAPISAGAAFDLLHSYDPLFWVFVVLSALPVGAVLLARHDGE